VAVRRRINRHYGSIKAFTFKHPAPIFLLPVYSFPCPAFPSPNSMSATSQVGISSAPPVAPSSDFPPRCPPRLCSFVASCMSSFSPCPSPLQGPSLPSRPHPCPPSCLPMVCALTHVLPPSPLCLGVQFPTPRPFGSPNSNATVDSGICNGFDKHHATYASNNMTRDKAQRAEAVSSISPQDSTHDKVATSSARPASRHRPSRST